MGEKIEMDTWFDGEAPTAGQESDPGVAGIDYLRRSERERLDLLDRIGGDRNALVLTYFTSIRDGMETMVYDDDNRIIENHLKQAHRDGVEAIDLFLMTYGGDATMPWNFYAMLRDYFPKAPYRVIIPNAAYSAGTGIALGGDEIVMGRSSVIGPTDTQVSRRGSVNGFLGFMQLLREFDVRSKLDDRKTLEWLTRNADPIELGQLYRVWRENRRKIMRILDHRRKPLSAKDNAKIADYLLYEIGIHHQGIRRREAIEHGITYITLLEQTKIEKEVDRLFHLYAEAMQLFTPFAHVNGGYDAYGLHISQTPVAIVESRYGTNPAFMAFRSDRHWNVAPPIGGRPRRQPAHIDDDDVIPGSAPEQPTVHWTTMENGRAARD